MRGDESEESLGAGLCTCTYKHGLGFLSSLHSVNPTYYIFFVPHSRHPALLSLRHHTVFLLSLAVATVTPGVLDCRATFTLPLTGRMGALRRSLTKS